MGLHIRWRWHEQGFALGWVLCLLATVPPLQSWLESSMVRHMLLQFPALMLGGALMAGRLSAVWQQRLQAWNAHGIAGLTGTAVVLALGMIPRVLDLALMQGWVDMGKCLLLMFCGAALRLSWQPAGIVVQGFFLGNVLPMMAIVGWLYQDALVRVCNAYRMDEQQTVGLALAWLSAAVACAWLARLSWRMTPLTPVDLNGGNNE